MLVLGDLLLSGSRQVGGRRGFLDARSAAPLTERPSSSSSSSSSFSSCSSSKRKQPKRGKSVYPALRIQETRSSLPLLSRRRNTAVCSVSEHAETSHERRSLGGEDDTSSSLLSCCEADDGPLSVAVLVSGGVDSSVALSLLKKAGHRLKAFYLQIWFEEDFENYWGACPWEEDLDYVKKVCRQLDVELEVVPLTKEYWSHVVSYSIEEIKNGCTPNPDMMCNSKIKFGAFVEYLEEKYPKGTWDRVASGHYARMETCRASASESDSDGGSDGVREKSRRLLCMSQDERKDQTYFLASLKKQQLEKCLFPIGCFPKERVREIAEDFDLANKDRKDSQGICFLGKVNFDEFIEKHLGTMEGKLVEHETNMVLGTHRGYWFHTIGQRRGIGLSHGPWYVTAKDGSQNIVYISKNYNEDLLRRDRSSFFCSGFNWIAEGITPLSAEKLRCKVRHGPTIYDCTFQSLGSSSDSGVARVDIQGEDHGFAPGQFVVFYDQKTCIGSAVICTYNNES